MAISRDSFYRAQYGTLTIRLFCLGKAKKYSAGWHLSSIDILKVMLRLTPLTRESTDSRVCRLRQKK